MRALPDPGVAFRALLFALWLVCAALVGYALIWYPAQVNGSDGRDTPMAVAEGSDVEAMAALLARERIAPRPRLTAVYLRLLGVDRRLRSGAVVLNRRLSLRDHLPRIAHGYGSAEVQVPIPEGFTRFDIAARLARFGVADAAQFLDASVDGVWLSSLGVPGGTAEGYLFPAAYRLQQDSTARAVLARMVRVFQERTRARFAAYAEAHAADAAALSTHDIVILASMIEREAQAADERKTISGVFYNRLRDPNFKPKRLQSDPTVAYGCLLATSSIPSCSEYDGRRITPAMVRDPENPYSTYRHEGLPPGPIANPGLASIDAALFPEEHAFFYFVAKGAGRHAFSHDLGEHNQRVRGTP